MGNKVTQNTSKNMNNSNVTKHFVDSGYLVLLTVMLYEKDPLPNDDFWIIFLKLGFPDNRFKSLLVWVARHVDDLSTMPVTEHLKWLNDKFYIDMDCIYDNFYDDYLEEQLRTPR